jgi:hypothetical protein
MGNTSANQIWDDFCLRFSVNKNAVPLFQATTSGRVATRRHGHDGRTMLCRSEQMESLVRSEAAKAVSDHQAGGQQIDGLIYIMGWRQDQRFVPLYIGKTEITGRGDRNLSVNLKNLDRDTSKFARWGDGYAYHVGDLSACVVHGHDPRRRQEKYSDWASKLFEQAPTEQPVLRRPVWFWAIAWDNRTTGIWQELGPTRLAFLEYILIGVASMISPDLLNREGRQRA